MNRNISILTFIPMKIIRQWVLLMALGFTTALSAQGVLSSSQTGTIQEISRSQGYITISGRNYSFDYDVTQVYYDGNEESSDFLNDGLVVRFTTNRDGVLARIEILGPLNLIEALVES
ncbi:MAG: hypothetical protein DHS20C12_07170 [Pseudohongiella sp.]|nr:MAG: hypothetical protein DHS20C12_07170 [Pseudohongiella sp.]